MKNNLWLLQRFTYNMLTFTAMSMFQEIHFCEAHGVQFSFDTEEFVNILSIAGELLVIRNHFSSCSSAGYITVSFHSYESFCRIPDKLRSDYRKLLNSLVV
jgi:hypothetical protein